MHRFALLFFSFAGPALAQDVCPEPPDHAGELAALMEDLHGSTSELEARSLSDLIWRLWTDAPDARAQELLNEGMRQREEYNFLGARDTFDTLIAYCPGYAEGYNQRAFASFLRQDYQAALTDLSRALELNPEHFGALSGKALALMGLGRPDEAQEVLRAALEVNPWLAERRLLVEPDGVDL